MELNWHLHFSVCLSGSLLFNSINAWLLGNVNFRVAFRCSAGVVFMTGVVCCWNFSARQNATSSQLERTGGGGGERFDAELDYDEGPRSSASGRRSSGCGPMRSATLKRYCALADVRQRPEIVLWNVGNCLSYLGFYMPFVNLVRALPLRLFPRYRFSFRCLDRALIF